MEPIQQLNSGLRKRRASRLDRAIEGSARIDWVDEDIVRGVRIIVICVLENRLAAKASPGAGRPSNVKGREERLPRQCTIPRRPRDGPEAADCNTPLIGSGNQAAEARRRERLQ